jgi:succinate dehydrogenase / fumarate reductase cytochrome b subunit
VILVGFVVGHLVGNLQIFPPDKINGYAQFLHQTGPLFWVVRIGLLVAVRHPYLGRDGAHLGKQAARGPEAMRFQDTIRRRWLHATMRWTGYIVLAFIVYHLAHFTLGAAHPADVQGHAWLTVTRWRRTTRVAGCHRSVQAGTVVPNVYLMVYRGFESAPVAIFYIIAVGLLSLHLLHGVDSLCQTLGVRSATWSGCLRRLVALLCLGYFLGNVAIPAAVLSGALAPHPAAQVHAAVTAQN